VKNQAIKKYNILYIIIYVIIEFRLKNQSKKNLSNVRVMMMIIQVQVQKVRKPVPKLQQLRSHERKHYQQRQLRSHKKLLPANQARHSNQANHQLLIVIKITKLQYKMITISVVFSLLNHVMQHVFNVNQVDAQMLVIK
jgi:hypothetical protein